MFHVHVKKKGNWVRFVLGFRDTVQLFPAQGQESFNFYFFSWKNLLSYEILDKTQLTGISRSWFMYFLLVISYWWQIWEKRSFCSGRQSDDGLKPLRLVELHLSISETITGSYYWTVPKGCYWFCYYCIFWGPGTETETEKETELALTLTPPPRFPGPAGQVQLIKNVKICWTLIFID